MGKREETLLRQKAYVDDKGLIHIDDAYIVSTNFEGLEKRNPNNPKEVVNSPGNRNFSVELTREAAELISNFRLRGHDDKAFKVQVKLPKEDAEDQTERIFMTVKLTYKYDEKGKPMWYNPQIRQYSTKGITEKVEENVGTIDDTIIDKADIIFSPGPYDKVIAGKRFIGLTAWLRQMNYKIMENELNAKWDQDYMTDDPTDFEEEPF